MSETDRPATTTLVGSPDQIYTSFPDTPTPPKQPQHQHPGVLLWISVSALVVLLGVGVSALVWFQMKGAANHNSETQAVQPTVAPTAESVAPSPSPASFTDKDLLGAWRTEVDERGQKTKITVAFFQDGSTHYEFTDAQGNTSGYDATWRYSDGVLYERYANGKSGRDSIRWIGPDEFELTILDNGNRSYAGVKRLYHRIIAVM
jgi:hypothetical protein